MITQSLHFEVSGQDIHRLLAVCRERNIEPVQAFQLFLAQFTAPKNQDDVPQDLRAQKLAYAGYLAHLANPDLMALEENAVEMAIKAKYGVD